MRADADVVFQAITDIEAYPRWQAEVHTVEVLARDEHGRPARARFVVDAKIFTADYTLKYRYGQRSVSWELVDSAQLRQLDGSYTVVDDGVGSAAVTYELVADPTVSVPRFLRRSAAQRIVRSALDNLKSEVERAT